MGYIILSGGIKISRKFYMEREKSVEEKAAVSSVVRPKESEFGLRGHEEAVARRKACQRPGELLCKIVNGVVRPRSLTVWEGPGDARVDKLAAEGRRSGKRSFFS